MRARISVIASYLPARTLTSDEVEQSVSGYRPPRGIVERMTGIRRRHVAAPGQQASDLAAEAALRILAPLAERGGPRGSAVRLGTSDGRLGSPDGRLGSDAPGGRLGSNAPGVGLGSAAPDVRLGSGAPEARHGVQTPGVRPGPQTLGGRPDSQTAGVRLGTQGPGVEAPGVQGPGVQGRGVQRRGVQGPGVQGRGEGGAGQSGQPEVRWADGVVRPVERGDIDLLIFASASQDMVEPATAHIVAAKLALTCPVFDVKNACNSLLNGIQIAEALILTGAHRRVLVCTGETPSRAIRWQVRDRAQFVDSFAGYTLSDSGAAVLVEADADRGIFYRGFSADSTAWAIGTLPGGGSAHPRDPDYSYFRGDGRRLKEAFELVGPDLFLDALKRTGMHWDDFAMVAVHQVALPYLDFLARSLDIPEDKLVVTLPEHGNCASATLPLQLSLGPWQAGDRVALLGLGGGISLGVMLAEM
ncbi:3-oxoacyl-ACP synthase III family protein [Nonomuraea sp. NPDC050663]|uniref:3-oxoacyl-ACP synthase III family protein n=1 Tax=Nonomuraea sp. NPDC050663 TaxID=3364370 RepID=UPI0037BC6E9C